MSAAITLYVRTPDFDKIKDGERLLCSLRRREIKAGTLIALREMDKRGRPAGRSMFAVIESESEASQVCAPGPSMSVWVSKWLQDTWSP